MKLVKYTLLIAATLMSAPYAIAHELQDDTNVPATQASGFADGTWTQTLDNSGRMIANLRAFDGEPKLLLIADLIPDLSGPETATQSRGSLRGYVYDATQPDPWKQPGEFMAVGTWQRSFDAGTYEVLILKREAGSDHFALAGRMQGTFGVDYQTQMTQGQGAGIVAGKQLPANEIAPDAVEPLDATSEAQDDTATDPLASSPLFVTNVLGQWVLY